VTFVDAFVLYSYFNWTGSFLGAKPEAVVWGFRKLDHARDELGPNRRMLTMLILGATLKPAGLAWTMVIGILGHAARFRHLRAFFPQAFPVIVIQLVHGICYASSLQPCISSRTNIFPRMCEPALRACST
jgi:hypothetical protein